MEEKNNNSLKSGSSEGKNNDSEHEENPNNELHQPRRGEGEGEGEGQEEEETSQSQCQQPPSSSTPFANMSLEDADLALARTLQEQERAYTMIRTNNNYGSDNDSWDDAGSDSHDDDDDATDRVDDHDEHESDGFSSSDDDVDAFDANDDDVELDPSAYSSDEAYARALQEAEERAMLNRLFAHATINDGQAVEIVDNIEIDPDALYEIDPDALSYEELLALGEVIGVESRGLSADTIASLPTVNYKTGSNQNGSNDSCVICHLDYEDGETLTVLSCKHSYHSECINKWLKINKVCPVCCTEVPSSEHS